MEQLAVGQCAHIGLLIPAGMKELRADGVGDQRVHYALAGEVGDLGGKIESGWLLASEEDCCVRCEAQWAQVLVGYESFHGKLPAHLFSRKGVVGLEAKGILY